MRSISPFVLSLGLTLCGSARAQGVGVACKIKELCAGEAPGGGRIMECLTAHRNELSEKCLAAIGLAVLSRRGRVQQGSPAAPAGKSEELETPAATPTPAGATPEQAQPPK